MMMNVFNPETVKCVYDFLAHDKETEIRLIDPHRQRMPQSIFVRDRSQFLRTCERYNGLYNVYAGLNERRLGGTKGEDVVSVKSIAIDLDAVRPDKSQPATHQELCQAYMTAETIARASKLFGFERPNACMSGNGYQLWYAIPTIAISDANRDEVEERIKQFNRLIKDRYESETVSIDNIGDLPRIIKVMGTLSIKGEHTEQRPHRLSYCVRRLTRREDPFLREYILSMQPEPKQEMCLRQVCRPPSFDHLLDKDPKLRSLFNGDVSSYPSRSEAEMALMVKLIFYGFSPDQIWELMQSAGIGKWEQSPEHYRERTYEKALQYVGVNR